MVFVGPSHNELREQHSRGEKAHHGDFHPGPRMNTECCAAQEAVGRGMPEDPASLGNPKPNQESPKPKGTAQRLPEPQARVVGSVQVRRTRIIDG